MKLELLVEGPVTLPQHSLSDTLLLNLRYDFKICIPMCKFEPQPLHIIAPFTYLSSVIRCFCLCPYRHTATSNTITLAQLNSKLCWEFNHKSSLVSVIIIIIVFLSEKKVSIPLHIA